MKDLIPFLSSLGLDCPSYHNPADFVMEVATGDYGRHLENMVEAAADPRWSTNSNGGGREKRGSSAFTGQSAPSSKEATPAPSDNSNGKQTTEAVAIQMDSSLKPGDNNDPECEQFLLGGSVESMDSGSGGSFPTTTCTQFRILFVRTFKSIIRDRTLTQLRLISHVGVGFLLGLLYWKIGNEASKVYNNSAMLFFCMLFSMFASMMPTVMTFPLEMATFKREHLNYWYSMKSYYLAKTMADMPFQIAYPVLFTAIVYTMTAQPLSVERVGMFVLMCVLTSLVAQSLGLVIGCASDIQTAVYLGPISTIPILLFSGFFVNLNNIPTVIHWLTYIAYVRYGFQGAMLAIYGFDRAPLHCSTGYCHYKYPIKWLEQMDMDGGAFWICVVALCVSFLFLRLVGYFVLRFKVWSER